MILEASFDSKMYTNFSDRLRRQEKNTYVLWLRLYSNVGIRNHGTKP